MTFRLAVAVLPVSSAPTKRLLVVLVKVPVAETVIFTLIIQLLFAASVPLENEKELAPAEGEKVGVPQLVVVAPGVLATVILTGKLSVKLKPLNVPGFGLVNVIVRAETPLTLVGFGLKLFDMLTFVGSTILAIREPTP